MVPAVPHPSEGQLAAGSGGRPVPIHDSRPDARQEGVPPFAFPADEAGRQAVARPVRLVEGGVEVAHADHLQQRAEEFLVRPILRPRNVDDTRGQQGASRVLPGTSRARQAARWHKRQVTPIGVAATRRGSTPSA